MLVFLDFQDGEGFRDISSLVKYDTLEIRTRACSDNWHYAQNEASFDVIYDPIIYPLLCQATKDTTVRIVENDNSSLTTEDIRSILTENEYRLMTESGSVFPVFYGHMPATRARSYNGIQDNTIFHCEATDELDLLKVKAGDIVLRDCYVMNPSDKDNSIVHQLLYIAGWTDDRIDNSIAIMDEISAFSPPSEDTYILDILDTLFFEYGYTLNINTGGQISPYKWMRGGELPVDEFNETNIVDSISISDSLKEYDGAEVTYYELAEASTTSGNTNMLLYQDSNLPYDSQGNFEGYPIPAGYRYPPKANVIDETTGTYQEVFQEYDDTPLKYWTNEAIVKRLDYNYKAFDSDYSAIVATYDHTLSYNADSGIVLVGTPEYGNRKARIVFQNPTGDSSKKLYYLNIYGKVVYKSSERKATVNNIGTDDANLDEYVSTYLFTKARADMLAQYLAEQHKDNDTYYSFLSEDDEGVGQLVLIKFDDGSIPGGVEVYGYITEQRYSEKDGLFEYKAKRYSTADLPALTSQSVKEIPNVQANLAAVNNAVVTSNVAASTSPQYLGRYQEAHPTNPSNGTWWTVYDSITEGTLKGVWWNNGGTYERITSTSTPVLQAKFAEALTDVAWAEANGYGVAADYGIETLFQTLGAVAAFFGSVFANQVTMASTGAIQSSNYVAGSTGFRLDSASGVLSAVGASIVGGITSDAGISCPGFSVSTGVDAPAWTVSSSWVGSTLLNFIRSYVSAYGTYAATGTFHSKTVYAVTYGTYNLARIVYTNGTYDDIWSGTTYSYTGTIDLSPNTVINIGGTIIPLTPASTNLGSSSNYFSNGFISHLQGSSASFSSNIGAPYLSASNGYFGNGKMYNYLGNPPWDDSFSLWFTPPSAINVYEFTYLMSSRSGYQIGTVFGAINTGFGGVRVITNTFSGDTPPTYTDILAISGGAFRWKSLNESYTTRISARCALSFH